MEINKYITRNREIVSDSLFDVFLMAKTLKCLPNALMDISALDFYKYQAYINITQSTEENV